MGSPGAWDNKGVNRARDWLEQARHNLRHAQGSLGLGDYAWACFAAQQAAEAALKGLHLARGQVAWGHSILDLLADPPRGGGGPGPSPKDPGLRGGKALTRVFRFDPKARLKEVAEAARALGERPEVLAVVLFGSLARGEATAFSDADLLVLLRETPLPFPERLVRYRPEGVRRVEVFPYTLSEALEGLKGGFGVVPAALREGRVLFEREGDWEALRRLA